MDVEWQGSPNFRHGRNGYTPMSIFFHVEAGSETGTMNWFKNPASEVSAHYSISRQGKISQYVREEDTAWAVGLVTTPSWEFYDKNTSPNFTTISIENEGYPQDGFTDVQIEANIWLAAEICKRWNIDVSGETVDNHQHLCGHYQLDPINRCHCPGDNFPWEQVIDGVKNKLYGNQEDELDMSAIQELNDLQASFAELVKEVHAKENRITELEKKNAAYEDESVPTWSAEAWKWAIDSGLIDGYGNGVFKPNAPVTRAQFAKMMFTMKDKK